MNPPRVTAQTFELLRRVGRWLRRHPLLAAGFLPALALAYVLALIPLTPAIVDIDKVKSEKPTVVLSADGMELAVFKRTNREWVKLGDISPHAIAAVIATEDRRFYEHRGIDVRRTFAAAWRTLRGQLQGGSTITQQLARNLYPDQVGRAPTVTRKVKEAITALKIEAAYGKDEILETYLNTVPFLYNAYGIEMAARTYFDKTAGELDVLESATLIGMLKGTSYYNPVLNPGRAVARRNTVLAQMVTQQRLAPAQFEALRNQPLGLEFERQTEPIGAAPHVAQQVRRWLIEWADRNGYDMYADGLVVRTTIDARLQAFAADAVKRQSDRLQALADAAWGRPGPREAKELVHTLLRESPEYASARTSGLDDGQALKKLRADTAFVHELWQRKTRLEAGFLAIEPGSGQVRAWIGSRDFGLEKFDHVQQARRQPGSTFKPFVYGAAFEQGIDPLEMLIDQEVEIVVDARTVWRPADGEPPTYQPMSLRDGLIHSKNTITAQLMQRVGASRVARLAYDMGVRHSKLDPVPSLALGTSPVTLKEMVTAFGSIANGGTYVEPVLVARVEDRHGTVLQEFHGNTPEPALSNTVAQTLLDVMRGVIDKGTGVGIRKRFGIQADVAGKTGTTQDYADGWFILMHPQLVAGAWVGFNDNRITMREEWGQGARNALNIVGDFFQRSLKTKVIDPQLRFTAPRQPSGLDPWLARMNDWIGGIFPAPAPPARVPWPDPAAAQAPEAPTVEVPLVVEPQSVPEAARAPAPDWSGRAVAPAPELQAPPARATRRVEGLPRILIVPGDGTAPQVVQPAPAQTVRAPVPDVIVIAPQQAQPPAPWGEAAREMGAPPVPPGTNAQ